MIIGSIQNFIVIVLLCSNYHERAVDSVPERRTVRILGTLSKRTFQGDAVVKSEKARDSRRRSRAKFNLLSTGAT